MKGKYIYKVLGWILTVIGVIAIGIPGIPTTPLLLLAAWLFAHSDRKFYIFLHRNKITGRYLRSYRHNKGMTTKAKISAITLMSCMISSSVYFFFWPRAISWVIIGAGIVGVFVIIFLAPSAKR